MKRRFFLAPLLLVACLVVPLVYAQAPFKGCPAEGTAKSAKNKAHNRLKNRDRAPSDIDASITLRDLMLKANDQKFDEDTAVRVTGFVVDVTPGGKTETCNCGGTAGQDMHIDIVQRRNHAGNKKSDWAQIALVIRPLAASPSPSPTPTPLSSPSPSPSSSLSPSPSPSPSPSSSPKCSATIPLFAQLFGPVQEEGAYTTQPTSAWTFPGSATSTSTKKFHFPFEYPTVRFAVWRVEWRPYSANNRLRLISMDDGPVNISTITEIAGADTSNPTAVTVVITDAINALIAAKQPKHLGWQIKGSGPVTVYQSHLEFHFCLP